MMYLANFSIILAESCGTSGSQNSCNVRACDHTRNAPHPIRHIFDDVRWHLPVAFSLEEIDRHFEMIPSLS